MTSLKDFFVKPGLMFSPRRSVFKGGEAGKGESEEKKDAPNKEQPKEGTTEYFMNVDNRVTLYKKVWKKVAELEKKGDDKSLKQAARLRRMMKTAAENEKDPVDPASHAERIYSALNIIEHPEEAKPMTDEEAETAMAWLDQQLGIPHVPMKPGSALAKKPEEKKPEEPVAVKKPEEKKKEEKKPEDKKKEEKPAVVKKPEEKPTKVAKVEDKPKAKPKGKDPLLAQLDSMDQSMKKGLAGGPSTSGVLKGSSVDLSGLDADKGKAKPDGGLKLGGSSGGPIKPGQGGGLASIDGPKAKQDDKKPDSGLGIGPSMQGPKAPKEAPKPKEEVKLGSRVPDTIKADLDSFQAAKPNDPEYKQKIVVRDNVQYRFARVVSNFGGGVKMTKIEVWKKELT